MNPTTRRRLARLEAQHVGEWERAYLAELIAGAASPETQALLTELSAIAEACGTAAPDDFQPRTVDMVARIAGLDRETLRAEAWLAGCALATPAGAELWTRLCTAPGVPGLSV